MGPGLLTVGSGAEARLKLASTEVAEIHFELELAGATVKLRPRPGVAAPKVAGQAATGELVLAFGKRIEIGGACLWVEAEPGEAAPPSSAPSAAATPIAPVVRRRDSKPASRRARRRRGMPAWVVPVVGVALLAVAFFGWRNFMRKSGSGEGLAQNKLRAAEQAKAVGRFDEARAELAGIPADALSDELAARKQKIEAEIQASDESTKLFFENEAGTKYLDAMLKKYEGFYLQGKPETSKVRLFLKRCRTFHERWPRHPELDWVTRQEARFAGYVDLNAPPTWDDASWEVKDLTDGMPRNYVAAISLLDELAPRAAPEEQKLIQKRRDELEKARPEYATDRLYQAKHEFEQKNDPNKAVWWLVHNVAWLGDEALANESARFLIKMPELDAHLRGYKKNYPERYAAVMANPIVSAWAAETGFKP
jgi:hypothetical protein